MIFSFSRCIAIKLKCPQIPWVSNGLESCLIEKQQLFHSLEYKRKSQLFQQVSPLINRIKRKYILTFLRNAIDSRFLSVKWHQLCWCGELSSYLTYVSTNFWIHLPPWEFISGQEWANKFILIAKRRGKLGPPRYLAKLKSLANYLLGLYVEKESDVYMEDINLFHRQIILEFLNLYVHSFARISKKWNYVSCLLLFKTSTGKMLKILWFDFVRRHFLP